MTAWAEALKEIAHGAIVSPDQLPEEIAGQVLRVIQLVREDNVKSLIFIGAQQKQREQTLEALEDIVALGPPRWPDQSDILRTYSQCKEIARAAIAAERRKR